MSKEIYFPAFAKINLFLRVKNRREDGYHEVESIYQTVSLADDLRFYPQEKDVEVIINPPIRLQGVEREMVSTTIKKVQEYTNFTGGVKVIVNKHIPLESGLGGGSADAAATLRALNLLWDLKLTKEELYSLAKEISADVSFLLEGGTVFSAGKGEHIKERFLTPEMFCLLVLPYFGISTSWAYQQGDLVGWEEISEDRLNECIMAIKRNNADKLGKSLFNSFEKVIFPRYVELASIKQKLLDSGFSGAVLSGSGSAIVAITDREDVLFKSIKDFSLLEGYKIYPAHFTPWVPME